LALVGNESRTVLWVRLSLFTIYERYIHLVLRFSAKHFSSERPLTGPTSALRCFHASLSLVGLIYPPPGLTLCLSIRQDSCRSSLVSRSRPLMRLAPLWRRPRRSTVDPGLPPPAPSTLPISHRYSGFLLRRFACLISYRRHL
jgi:hypothetical protein